MLLSTSATKKQIAIHFQRRDPTPPMNSLYRVVALFTGVGHIEAWSTNIVAQFGAMKIDSVTMEVDSVVKELDFAKA
jgi:hypothetical protein